MSLKYGNSSNRVRLDVVIIGAGFSGLYMLHEVRRRGLQVKVLEAGDGVGGVWFWNRYPGARCDIESMDYSYSFSPELEQEWSWSERNASQPEILAYLNHVADRFDLRRDIELSTQVNGAEWDDQAGTWFVTTETGRVYEATFVITAVGCLSVPITPHYQGLETFTGEVWHTAAWPIDADFAGKRVGVIGTGSSGIQVAPRIAEVADRLFVFQRTPHYAVPARNAPLDPDYEQSWKQEYAARRLRARYSRIGVAGTPDATMSAFDVTDEQRTALFDAAWASGTTRIVRSFTDVLLDTAANDTVANYVRDRIRETVRDPETAELLTPRKYHIGVKRLCMESGYYDAFNRDNVELVDIERAPLVRIVPSGIETTDKTYELDAIVLATGFDAVTGALIRLNVRGRGGRTLAADWADGPSSYLGLMSAGYPNFFTITGPRSPAVLSNMVTSIEQHVEWIADCLDYLTGHGFDLIEADPDAEREWVAHVDDVASATLLVTGRSFYLGSNVPGKARTFLPFAGGVGTYRRICEDVVANEYRGFTTGSTETLRSAAGSSTGGAS